MTTDKEILKAIQPITQMYNEMETELLIEIASHFKANEELLNSDYWRLQKLDELGLLNQKTIDYISKYSNKSKKALLQAMKDIGYSTYNIKQLDSAFKDGQFEIDPNTLIENGTVDALIKYRYNDLDKSLISMSSKIKDSVRQEYLKIVDKAYLEVSSGTKSYNQSIRESIDELSYNGLKTLQYKTISDDGATKIRSYDIESAVKREILTNTRALSGDIEKATIDELKPEYVKFSEHINCRPSHFDWQGTIVKREQWESIANFGEVDGIYGINCRHYVEPYFGDSRGDDLKEISKEEALKNYQMQQKKNYLQRNIRKWKRRKEMYKANGDNEMLTMSKQKISSWQSKTDSFTKSNNIKRDYANEYVTSK